MTAFTPARRLSPLTGLANTFTLTWRSLVKLKTNPEDLPGLVLTPIMYLVLFTYIFGGAISGNVHNYLQFELPGILVLAVIFSTLGTGQMLSQDVETGVFDRFRSLPIARWAPLFGAVLGDVARYALSVAVTLAFGMLLGFRIQTNPLAASSRVPARARLRAGHVLVFRAAGPGGGQRAGRAVDRVADLLPADLWQQRAGADRQAAGLAAGVRQGQPDDVPDGGRAGPAGRRPSPDAGDPDPAVVTGPGRGLRADRRPGLPPAYLIEVSLPCQVSNLVGREA